VGHNQVSIDLEVVVYQNVAHAGGLGPHSIGMALPKWFGQTPGCLSNDLQMV
jgi:hypothetical protein